MSDSATREDKLAAIAGRWNTSGYVIGDPRLPVEGTDIYEVLAGGHFLVHHVDVTVGGQEVRAIEVIGEPDPDSDAYLVRSFDSDGNFEVMKLRIDDDGTFHFAGAGDIAPTAQPGDAPTAQVRSTLTVSQDRASMRAFWERSEDGSTGNPGWTSRSHAANDAAAHRPTTATVDAGGRCVDSDIAVASPPRLSDSGVRGPAAGAASARGRDASKRGSPG